MKYHCRQCNRDFDLPAMEETTTTYYPQITWTSQWSGGNTITVPTYNYNTTTVTKTPVCPFCHSKEIQET